MDMDTLAFGAQRIVHLDLKGAPPRPSFYEKYFPYIKLIGATGVLLEWEDTFPYMRELVQIGSLSECAATQHAPYNPEEAKHILRLAAENGLLVIPLIQTFGHMEFVLKHEEYASLREVDTYPSSMCPSNSQSMLLVTEMVKQIVDFHPKLQYLHIGADEVWHMGHCLKCASRIVGSKYGKASLYLDHLTEVAHYIKEHYPTLRIIMWDDMLRSIDETVLLEYKLGGLVEPMVWHYHNADTFQLTSSMWDKYCNVFNNIWGASAFKGATSSCQVLPISRYHISNQEAWLAELAKHGSKIRHFRGMVFTGWSRYDHYATLCELLPCATPSLNLCLQTWISGGYNVDVFNAVIKLLGYNHSNSILYLDSPIRPVQLPAELKFPGWEVLIAMEWFANVKAKYKSVLDSDQIQTWFNPWQILNNYTNPMQLQSILPIVTELHLEITSLDNFITTNFARFFYPPTLDEILGTLVQPIKQHLWQLKFECESQISSGCRVRGQKLVN